MHAELFRGLALITAMTREDFEDKALLELAHRVSVTKAGGVHLEDEIVEFAFQSRRFLMWSNEGAERSGLHQLLINFATRDRA
jgi:hypothetical protein